MQSIFLVLCVICCIARDIHCQNFQYFYSFPSERFAPVAPRQHAQLFYQQQQSIFDSIPQFYNQAPTVPEYQFKNPGAHVQPHPPSFYESSFRIPGAHVQPPPPTFFHAGFQPSSQASQFKIPGAHVQPAPPTFYQSPIQMPNTNGDYRGYSYHVNYDDGARSSVVFFRGGVEYDITLPNRITVASDIVDPQQAKNRSENVQRALDHQTTTVLNNNQKHFQSLQPLVEELLSQPFEETGIVHFYDSQHGLPASTSLLSIPSSQNDESISMPSTDTKDTTDVVDTDDTVSIDAATNSNRNAKSLDIVAENETENGASSTDTTTIANESTTEISSSNSSSTTELNVSNTPADSNETTNYYMNSSNTTGNTDHLKGQQNISTSSEVPRTTTQLEEN